MKNSQKGFMIPLAIIIVLLMVSVVGFYFLKSGSNSDNEIEENQISTGAIKVDDGKTINLSNNGLKSIPKEIFSKTETEELDISNNSITGSIQGEIRFLSKLKILNASNNSMTGIPAEIGHLKNLEVLDLSNNNLTGLPNELGNLDNLKILDLSGNSYSKQDLEIIRTKLSPSVNIIEISANTEENSSIEDLENNICNLDSECKYISYVGSCNTLEYVVRRQKEASEQGLYIGEAPPIEGEVTCTCESNKCVTSVNP